jgi:ABC-type multidrug transport system permease subunit
LVVLGTDGRLDYFGPVEEDILYTVFGSADQNYGSLCDLVLRGESTFDDSKYKTQLLETLAGYRSQPKTSLNTILPAKKYSTSGYHQFWILCRRRTLLIARNAVTYTRIIIAVVFGIIIGSLFSALKQDIAGSLGRTGYMFLNCFLVLMLSSAVVLPQGFRQRPTLYKHRVAEFYSGRIAYLSQVVMDIPLSIMEAILLSIISYFWVDMRSGAGYFFYFWGTLVGLEFVGQALGRLLVALIRKQVSANAWSTVLIIGFGTVAGFMPSYRGIPPVLRWLSWLTPVSYAFEGLMLNEFSGRELMIFAVSADDGDSGTGVMTGDAWLQAFSLPRVDWGSTDSIQALNLIMLFIFAVILDLLGMYYSERTRSWYHDPTRRLQSRVKSLELKAPENTMLSSKRSTTEDKTPPSSQTTDWPNSLVVRNLFYHVPLGSKKKKFSFQSILAPCLVRLSGKKVPRYEEGEDELTLLNGVEARFARGRMCALMGSR